VANAGLQSLGYIPRPGGVATVYRRGEPVFTFVGYRQRFLLTLHPDNGFYRAKGFLLPYPHAAGHPIKQRGAHLGGVGFTTG
jgi:hypothetical protein